MSSYTAGYANLARACRSQRQAVKSRRWSLTKCGASRVKKNKLWAVKAIDRSTRKTVAWVLGNRNTATFRRLYKKVEHLKDRVFYTGDWKAFSDVLPPERHVVGKEHTAAIERGNSSARQRLARFARRAKVACGWGTWLALRCGFGARSLPRLVFVSTGLHYYLYFNEHYPIPYSILMAIPPRD